MAAPTITNQDPAPSATGASTADVSFSLEDDLGVDLVSVVVTVEGAIIYENSTFASGWTTSTVVANGSNGYDFVCIPDDQLPALTTINVDVEARDFDLDLLSTSWSFITGLRTGSVGNISGGEHFIARAMDTTAARWLLVHDGEWKVFNPQPSLSFASRQQGLWGDRTSTFIAISGKDNYISHFEDGVWTDYEMIGHTSNEMITIIVGNDKDDLWGVSTQSRLWHWDGVSWTIDTNFPGTANGVSALLLDSQDRLWYAFTDNADFLWSRSGGVWTDQTAALNALTAPTATGPQAAGMYGKKYGVVDVDGTIYCVGTNGYGGGDNGDILAAKWGGGTDWTVTLWHEQHDFWSLNTRPVRGDYQTDEFFESALESHLQLQSQDGLVYPYSGPGGTFALSPHTNTTSGDDPDAWPYGHFVITDFGNTAATKISPQINASPDWYTEAWTLTGGSPWTERYQLHSDTYRSSPSATWGIEELDLTQNPPAEVAKVAIGGTWSPGATVWMGSGPVGGTGTDHAAVNATVDAATEGLYYWDAIRSTYFVAETNPPVVSNQDPINGATNVLLSADTCFSVEDDTFVAAGTFRITFGGQVVYENDAFTAGWTSSTLTLNSGIKGYDVCLTPDDLLIPNQEYEVQVEVSDIYGNELDASWSFETIIITEPFTTHQLTVSNIEVIGSNTPGAPGSIRPVNRLNQFDEHGSIVGVSRLRGEKNYAYKRRIQDAMVHRANSSYRGMVNGVTRELGLTLFEGLSINPKRDGSGQFLASDPYIAFDGVYLLLYSDLSTDALDWAIDRHQAGGNFEHLGRLVDVVNDTEFFEAELLPDVDPFMRSMSVLNQSNRNEVRIEFVPQSTKFRLKHQHIVPGSLFFSNRNTFRLEVAQVTDVISRGKYHIDYTTGIVTVYTTPRHQEYARYRYTQYPFRALASPVILHDINRDSFRVKMFEQVLQDNGEFAHGLPTELGVDIINELMTVSPMYWGI